MRVVIVMRLNVQAPTDGRHRCAAVWLVEAEIAPSYFKTRLVYRVRYRLKSWALFFRVHPFRYRGAPARSSVPLPRCSRARSFVPVPRCSRACSPFSCAVHPRRSPVSVCAVLPRALTRSVAAVLPPTLFRFRCRGAPAHAHASRCAVLPRTLIRSFARCSRARSPVPLRGAPAHLSRALTRPVAVRLSVVRSRVGFMFGRIQVRVPLRFSRFPCLCQVGFRLLAPLSVSGLPEPMHVVSIVNAICQ
jgi:hypothetical protein